MTVPTYNQFNVEKDAVGCLVPKLSKSTKKYAEKSFKQKEKLLIQLHIERLKLKDLINLR